MVKEEVKLVIQKLTAPENCSYLLYLVKVKLNTRQIQILFFAITFCLVGLIVLQVNWLNKSINSNERLFLQTMDFATYRAAEIYREQSDLPEYIHRKIINPSTDTLGIDGKLKQIINTAFQERNLPLSYTYGIYKQDGVHSNLVFGDTEVFILENASCTQKPQGKFSWAPLTCNMGYGDGNDYQLAVHPNKGTFIAIQVRYTLFLSILFIALVLFGFYYLTKIIKRQRKVSEMKNDFINNLTHEFKTPIFSISLASKSLRKSFDSKISDTEATFLDVIDTEGERLKQQVNRILQLSLLENKKIELAISKVNLHDLIKGVTDDFSLILEKAKGKIQWKLNAPNAIIEGDELHLSNCIKNIVDNAIKYSEASPMITISTHQGQNSHIRIVFEDNGIGMDKEKQKRIFDKFYRVGTGDLHDVKGFGVGLSYVKEIIILHKGSIVVKSQKGKGSTFTIELPMYEQKV
ncbi:HAMP domain-containing sensor histidine kinase [Aureisphaera galaxeae]|uniref:sensor histidine kinase n=1 Tax=Aureisphaera galaxeae TaxID=1538023 RepID=UPI002350152D|nr:HAMP domain-containing sensor histidine kinase [Aureisphaera galaxeae]MDC8005697.1 HAMP domain-containing sensor histidine kinase [Aureisphaera galaxeae]